MMIVTGHHADLLGLDQDVTDPLWSTVQDYPGQQSDYPDGRVEIFLSLGLSWWQGGGYPEFRIILDIIQIIHVKGQIILKKGQIIPI